GNGSTTGDGAFGSAPGGGGGGSDDNSGATGGTGGDGKVTITWVDVSDFNTSAPTSICSGQNTTVTLTSTTLAAGTYFVNYTTTTVQVAFSGTTTKTGTFSISGLTGPSSSITINSVGFNNTCGSVPQGNNTANVSISLPIATITKTDITCFGAADGTINVSGSGGTSPYTFSINNGVNYSSLPS